MGTYDTELMKEKAGKNSQLLLKLKEAEQMLEDILDMDVDCDQPKTVQKDGSIRTYCGMVYKKGDIPRCPMKKNLYCGYNKNIEDCNKPI